MFNFAGMHISVCMTLTCLLTAELLATGFSILSDKVENKDR